MTCWHEYSPTDCLLFKVTFILVLGFDNKSTVTKQINLAHVSKKDIKPLK